MNTISQIQPASIPGAVIDPETGRLCATIADFTRAIGIAGSQVVATGATKYQRKYYDVEEVLNGRKTVRQVGRPRGIILTELTALVAAAIAGTTLAAGVIATAGRGAATDLRGAVGHMESIVSAMEDLGSSGASTARTQWDANREIALGRIGALENLNTEGTQP